MAKSQRPSAPPAGVQPLPPRANFEHLKNQAKKRLGELRQSEPGAKLADAQYAIAKQYGFTSWRAMKAALDVATPTDPVERFRAAIRSGGVQATRRILEASPQARAAINDPMGDFGRRPIHLAAGNAPLLDVLLAFGADINLRSDWANGPFSVLDEGDESQVRALLARGARLTPHAAARLGWVKELRAMIQADPGVVHEMGGDGQRPLHFAGTREVIDLLLDHGSDIDARCVDHKSTPAQYMADTRQELARYLLERGATPDIFLAARLGDLPLIRRLVEDDPRCLRARINAPGYDLVPPGTIYCWKLDWYLSPHECALKFEQREAYDLLWALSDRKTRLMVACARGDASTARQLLRDHPSLLSQLSAPDHQTMTHAMFHGQRDSVKLMLSLGFDPMATGVDGGTLLHTASWFGDAEIVSILLTAHRDRIDLEDRNDVHGSSPLGWAAHGAAHCWRKGGDYRSVIRLLVEAGADPNATANKVGTPMVEQAAGNIDIQRFLRDLGAAGTIDERE